MEPDVRTGKLQEMKNKKEKRREGGDSCDPVPDPALHAQCPRTWGLNTLEAQITSDHLPTAVHALHVQSENTNVAIW